MLYYLFLGVVLGLSAGFSPGPLMALVISESLRHGSTSGIKVAFAPVITDFPLIIFSIFILSGLEKYNYILAGISIVGACYLVYMGIENIRSKPPRLDLENKKSSSFIKGILTNIVSPNPYLFWISVGAPIMNKALKLGLFAPFLFLCGFYFFLVAIKILIAVLVAGSRQFINGTLYLYVMRALGLSLFGLALLLLREGVMLSGLL